VGTVFLSYRHENDTQRALVRAFGERLRAAGIEVLLDQFFLDRNPGGPDEGWPAWSKSQAMQSEKILIVGSPGWYRCYDGNEVPGAGLGAASEGRVIAQRIYNESGLNRFARLAFFDPADRSGVSLDLQAYRFFHADNDFDDIVKWITHSYSATSPANPLTSWPAAHPVMDWHPAGCEAVCEAFKRLLTADSSYRVLLICGPSGTGKTHLTRYLLSLALSYPGLACGRFDLKSGGDLDGEFASFTLHLGIDEAGNATAGQALSVRLAATFKALRARGQPTLLLFDTFEQGGEWARWMEWNVLLAIPRAPWLRVLLAGPELPHLAGASWASFTAPVVSLGTLGWEPWYQFGKRYLPDLTPEFIQQAHRLSRGSHSLLGQLLIPQI
jgi:hypothetical protein